MGRKRRADNAATVNSLRGQINLPYVSLLYQGVSGKLRPVNYSELERSMTDATLTANATIKHGDYWHGLIDENDAARFLGLRPRTMQKFRYEGGGPNFVRLSSRCVKYRRLDLCRKSVV